MQKLQRISKKKKKNQSHMMNLLSSSSYPDCEEAWAGIHNRNTVWGKEIKTPSFLVQKINENVAETYKFGGE